MKQMLMLGGFTIAVLIFVSCHKEDDLPEASAGRHTVEVAPEIIQEAVPNGTPTLSPYVENISYVDKEIHTVLQGDEFKQGNYDIKLQVLLEVLNVLVDEQYLEDFTVYEENPEKAYVGITYVGGGMGFVPLYDPVWSDYKN